jgi:hypothetical protein
LGWKQDISQASPLTFTSKCWHAQPSELLFSFRADRLRIYIYPALLQHKFSAGGSPRESMCGDCIRKQDLAEASGALSCFADPETWCVDLVMVCNRKTMILV